MNFSPTSQTGAFQTGSQAIQTADDRRLLVALSDSAQDAVLLNYSRYWAGLHGSGAGAPTDLLAGATRVAGATRNGEDLYVTAPQRVEGVRLTSSGWHTVAELIHRAGQPGIDALAVGDRLLARDLIRHAPCSVWFVSDTARPAARRLLVPIDFSVRAADSLRVAAVLARLSGAAECVALHVCFNDAVLSGSWGDEAVRQTASTRFDRFLAPINMLGVKVTPCIQDRPDVARAISETAAEVEADLIVLASRGRTWAASLLQPSVAELTLAHCRVPLLVVKHFGTRRSFLSLLVARLSNPAIGLRSH